MIAWLRQPHVKRRCTIAFNWISVVGTLVTIWWFVRHLNVHQLGAAFGRATAGPLIIAVLLGLVSQANRALGWTVMLGPAYPVPYRRQFRYELTAQAASVLMPARAGELLRVWLLRAEEVPASTTLALIAVKKLFEGLGLAVLSLLALSLLTGLPRWLTNSILGFAAVIAALVVGLVVGARKVRPKRADSRWGRFVGGLGFVRDSRRLLATLGLAMVGEVLDCAAVLASLHALDIRFPVAAAAVILFMVDTSNLFPSGPAHVGTFEVGVLAAFDALHAPTAPAVAFAVIFHAQQVLSQLVVGVPFLLRVQMGRRRAPQRARSSRDGEPHGLDPAARHGRRQHHRRENTDHWRHGDDAVPGQVSVSRSGVMAATAVAMCAVAVLLLRPHGSAAPGWSADLYLRLNTVTASLPGWLATTCAAFAPLGLVVLGGVAGTAAWRCWRDRSQAGEQVAAVIAGLIVALLLAEVIKAVIHEPRPCRVLIGVVSRVGCPASGHWSFPSSHANAAAALAAAVLLLSSRVWWLAAGLAALIGFDRVMLGEHYPHDVLAGFLLGAGVTIAVAEALRPLSRRLRPARTEHDGGEVLHRTSGSRSATGNGSSGRTS